MRGACVDTAFRDDGGDLRSNELRPGGPGIASAADTLRDLKMPADAVGAVLGTDDPEIVHRRIELHRELLEERLDEQRRALALLERLLIDAISERRHGSVSRPAPRP
jgi:hypothetical protein